MWPVGGAPLALHHAPFAFVGVQSASVPDPVLASYHLSAKNALGKEIQIVLPLRRVVRVALAEES